MRKLFAVDSSVDRGVSRGVTMLLQQTVAYVLNFILMSDPVSVVRIRHLRKFTLKIICNSPEFVDYLVIEHGRVLVSQVLTHEADTVIRGNAADLVQMIQTIKGNKKETNIIYPEGIQITGDKDRFATLLAVIKQSEPDWEGMLAEKTHPVFAHAIGQGVQAVTGMLKQKIVSQKLNLSEYLQEELTIIPPYESVRTLDGSLEKIKLRIQSLESRVNALLKNPG